MNNKDTFDILHSEFDDCPELPDSLSKRSVVAKLNNISREKQSTISFKKLASLVAAMILVLVCAIVGSLHIPVAPPEDVLMIRAGCRLKTIRH